MSGFIMDMRALSGMESFMAMSTPTITDESTKRKSFVDAGSRSVGVDAPSPYTYRVVPTLMSGRLPINLQEHSCIKYLEERRFRLSV